jgi:hypothetical protein
MKRGIEVKGAEYVLSEETPKFPCSLLHLRKDILIK